MTQLHSIFLMMALLPLLAACTAVDTAKENLRSGPEVVDVTNLAAVLPVTTTQNAAFFAL